MSATNQNRETASKWYLQLFFFLDYSLTVSTDEQDLQGETIILAPEATVLDASAVNEPYYKIYIHISLRKLRLKVNSPTFSSATLVCDMEWLLITLSWTYSLAYTVIFMSFYSFIKDGKELTYPHLLLAVSRTQQRPGGPAWRAWLRDG